MHQRIDLSAYGLKRIGIGLLCVAGALVVPPAAWAETEAAAESDLASPADENLLFQDVPSVFGASKYEQKITDAPSAISVVTADEIRRLGYQSLDQILASLPGIFATSDRNYGYLGVRGLSLPGDYNSRMLFLIDGHRINEPVYDSVGIQQDFPLDVELIDRVEVIRGPVSSLYGTNASFGVVNIITRRGRELSGGEGAGRYGTDTSYKTRLTYGDRLANGVEYLVSTSDASSDGKRILHYPEFAALGMTSRSYDADNEGAQRVFADVGYGGFRLQGGYSDRERGIPTGSFSTVLDESRNATTDEWNWLSASYERDVLDWQLRTAASWDRYRYHGDYLYDYGAPGSPDLVLNLDDAEGQRAGLDLNATRVLLGKHRLTFGSELREDYMLDQHNEDEDGTVYVDSDESQSVYAAYAQADVELHPRLRLNGGLRFDHFDSFGSHLSPRVALIYQVADPTTLKLIYGEAFRAPNPYELFYVSATYIAPDSLEPETIRSYELVLEQRLDSHFRLTGSLYHYDIEDMIQQLDIGGGILQFQNVGQADGHGLELRLDGEWAEGYRLGLGYSIQRSETDFIDDVPNSPHHLIQLTGIAPVFEDRLSLATELGWMSQRYTLQGDRVDDRLLANLTFIAKTPLEGLELDFGVKNALDDRYSDPGGAEHIQDSLEQNGRTFWFGTRYQF